MWFLFEQGYVQIDLPLTPEYSWVIGFWLVSLLITGFARLIKLIPLA